MNWKPRKSTIIVKGIVKKEFYDRKMQIVEARAKLQKNEDGDPVEEIELDGFEVFDILDEDDNYLYNAYRFFIHDKGEEVSNDILIGDEVYVNIRNVSMIADVTDMTNESTFFYITDGMVIMRRPAPVQI